MASRASLRSETLVALGAERLAKLILDEAAHNAPFKRIATAALAATKGPDAIAALVDRRLSSLERARGFIDYERRKEFATDLSSLVAVVSEELGGVDPGAASERLLRFLRGEEAVLNRVDDSSGAVQALYEDAAHRLAGLVARTSGAERRKLVETLVALLLSEVGRSGSVLVDLVPVLEPAERVRLDDSCRKATSTNEGRSDGWRQAQARRQLLQVRKAIADVEGDVDAFMALEATEPEARRDGFGIAERLMKAGRLTEALAQVRKPTVRTLKYVTREDLADGAFDFDVIEYERIQLEIEILVAMKDEAAAQTLRLRTFRDQLDADMLRDYLAKLPDFEDDDALEAAFAHVAAHPRRHAALVFFLDWPRFDLAAKLVVEHAAEWNGRAYEVLSPAAAALETDHPVAATILYRILIDDVLTRGRSSAYGHAARHLETLDRLASHLDGALVPDQDAYRAGLQKAHGRKHGFWSRL